MALFAIDFVFSCPCFVSDVLNAIKISAKNNDVGVFGNRNHVVKNFEVDNFEKDKFMFICCFDHLLDGMYFDTKMFALLQASIFSNANWELFLQNKKML